MFEVVSLTPQFWFLRLRLERSVGFHNNLTSEACLLSRRFWSLYPIYVVTWKPVEFTWSYVF